MFVRVVGPEPRWFLSVRRKSARIPTGSCHCAKKKSMAQHHTASPHLGKRLNSHYHTAEWTTRELRENVTWVQASRHALTKSVGTHLNGGASSFANPPRPSMSCPSTNHPWVCEYPRQADTTRFTEYNSEPNTFSPPPSTLRPFVAVPFAAGPRYSCESGSHQP